MTLDIDGMTCGGCVLSVERALSEVAGVHTVRVVLAEKRAHVEGAGLDRERLVRAAYDAGYDAR